MSGRSIPGFTDPYAPPEQIEGTGTDARSDLYALGATLYHLLTRVQPPNALNRLTAKNERQGDSLRRANKVDEEIPRRISKALDKAMALNRKHRPKNVGQMRKMLFVDPNGTDSNSLPINVFFILVEMLIAYFMNNLPSLSLWWEDYILPIFVCLILVQIVMLARGKILMISPRRLVWLLGLLLILLSIDIWRYQSSQEPTLIGRVKSWPIYEGLFSSDRDLTSSSRAFMPIALKGYTAPSDEGPETSYPSPSDGEPETSYPSPSDGEPETPYPSPSDGEPETSYPSPSDGEPETSYPSPSDGEPETSYPSPSDEGPETQSPSPSDGEPETSYPSPSDEGPETQSPSPSDGEPERLSPSPTRSQLGSLATPTKSSTETLSPTVRTTETERDGHSLYLPIMVR